MADPMDTAWAMLRSRLEVRSRELYEEVRAYPRPIARCDEQLTKAIEERDVAFRRLRRANDLDEQRAALGLEVWRTAVLEFVAELEIGPDEVAVAARHWTVCALGRG
jgi:hypothetical protein